MKKTLFLVMVLFGVFLLNNATQTYGMEMSAEQKVFWERIQKGWELWKNADREGFKTGAHKNYTFWSSTRIWPEGKDYLTVC